MMKIGRKKTVSGRNVPFDALQVLFEYHALK